MITRPRPRTTLPGLCVLMTCCLTALLLACRPDVAGNPEERSLTIFHAGSLTVPMKDVVAAFRLTYPNVKVLMEAAGSRECARKISELGRGCDVFASADYTVINTLLVPEFAPWCIKFAGNEMVIAYTKTSRRGGEINRENWPAILLDEQVDYGRSEPDSDPCGYRTVLTIKLAEAYYEREGLAAALLAKNRRNIRPKETDLLALLETHNIDYVFIYRSVAVQHGLEILTLPGEINLQDPALAEHYRTVTVDISGKNPGETVTKAGEPMVYGVTIPNNAPDPEMALAFVSFLLDPRKGMPILERHGQPSLVTSPSATYAHLPEALKRFAREERP